MSGCIWKDRESRECSKVTASPSDHYCPHHLLLSRADMRRKMEKVRAARGRLEAQRALLKSSPLRANQDNEQPA